MTGGELELREDDELEAALSFVEENPRLVVPLTGQVYDLTRIAEQAEALLALRESVRRSYELIELVSALVRVESRRQGTKTLHLPTGRVATVSGGETTVYDAERLAAELAAAGMPEERVADVVRPVVEWKVDRRALRSVVASNPLYAEAAARCSSVVFEKFRVAVK